MLGGFAKMHVNYREIGRFPYYSGDFGRNLLHFNYLSPCVGKITNVCVKLPGFTGKLLLFRQKRSKKALAKANLGLRPLFINIFMDNYWGLCPQTPII